jgi:hypothetical protein
MAFLVSWRLNGCKGIGNSECGIRNMELGMGNSEGEIGVVSGWFSRQDVELVNNKKQEIVNSV